MAALKEYTLDLYRQDSRATGGRRLVDQLTFAPVTADYIDTVVQAHCEQGYTVELVTPG